MSINATLQNALSGLRVTSRMTEATSNNLANALTDGYGRQVITVASVAQNGFGAGVRVSSIERAMAAEYTASRRQADGAAAQGSAIADALGRIGQALGEADGEDGLFLRVSEFEAQLRALAETPEASTRQIAVIDAARDVASTLNRLSDFAATIRQDADAAVATDVARVNANLVRIDDINTRIQRMPATDTARATLVDERERLVDEIAAIIPVRTREQTNGALHIYTAEGVFLLQERPQTVEFSPNAIITAPMAYVPGGGGALSGLTIGGQDITPGSGGRFAVQSGSLAGHFAVRDETGVTFRDRIDRFAADLISRFQNPAVDPTLAATDPGLFTDAGGQLDLSDLEGLAGRIALNAFADPAQGGTPRVLRDGLQSAAAGPPSSDANLRRMLDALCARQSGSGVPGLDGMYSATELAAGIVEATAIARTDAEIDSGRLTATRAALADAEAGRIGVDQDAEMARLIQIEQAYSANAQVIQTVSRMLQDLMELR